MTWVVISRDFRHSRNFIANDFEEIRNCCQKVREMTRRCNFASFRAINFWNLKRLRLAKTLELLSLRVFELESQLAFNFQKFSIIKEDPGYLSDLNKFSVISPNT